MVVRTFQQNVEKVKQLLLETIPLVRDYDDCRCAKDIKNAIMSK